jgi:colicin import membrane protein
MRVRRSGYRFAVLASGLLHGGILALLMSGWHPEFQPRQLPQTTYMEAALLQVEAPPAAPRPVTKPEVEPAPPQADPAPAPPQADPAEVQRQRAAAEKAAQEKAAREKAAAEKTAREKAAREKAAAEKAAREKAAAEKAAREKAAAEKAAREKAAQEKAAQEKAAQERAARQAAAQQLVASYESYVRDRITGNWNRPPSARRDMEVELQVRLVPTGQVMSVAVVRSSGDPAFDQSAVNAVQQVGRFDRLQELSRKDPLLFEQNFRTLNLTFRPDDLRL